MKPNIRGSVLLALAIAAPVVQAALQATLYTGTTQVTIMSQSSIVIQLEAGPQGGTTISTNKTGARSAVSGTPLVSSAFNTTVLNNTNSANFSVRLRYVSIAANIGQCAVCDLEFRVTGDTRSQIQVRNGVVQQSLGSWVRINGTGFPTSKWHLYAVAQSSGLADTTASMAYQLEYVPFNAASPLATYYNMTMVYTV